MLRLGDAFKLAYTKLRTRKLRMLIALLTSSLLFGILIGGSLVTTGALASIDSFSREGFSNRYILAGLSMEFESPYGNDSGVIARAEQLEKEDIVAKKAAAKKLAIDYVAPSTETGLQAVFTDQNGAKSLNVMSPFAQKAIVERQLVEPNQLGFEKFKKQVGTAVNYYKGVSKASVRMDSPTLTVLRDGKEPVMDGSKPYSPGGYSMMSGQTGLQTMTSDWNLLDDTLLKPFLLKGQNLSIGTDGSIPIIASYSASQEVLKMTTLPKNASAEQKKQRLEEVRQKIAGQTFEVCYRNSTSMQDLQVSQQNQADIKQNSSMPGYVKPELIYKPSPVPCQAPLVERDVRSAETKLYQQRQDQFDQQFGKVTANSQILKFRIVGVTQDSPYSQEALSGGSAFGAMEIINAITASTIGARWVSPYSVMASSAAIQDVFALSPAQTYVTQELFLAEYDNPVTAREVLEKRSCAIGFGGPTANASLPTCSRTGPVSYSLQPYGSASLAIYDFKKGFQTLQMWALLIIGSIAAVILIGIVGRIIADGRKETAVFRATGASRLMIAQIYLAYTIYLVLIIVILALALGFSFALWMNSMYSPDASINMALLFNVSDLNKQFNFYGFELYDVGIITLAVLAAAVAGASVPIASNIQRNPIRDMRDE